MLETTKEDEEREGKGEGRREEGRGSRVAYQNVGGSIEATNILLTRGKEAGWDYVFVAEA